jgi:hypothetical protein
MRKLLLALPAAAAVLLGVVAAAGGSPAARPFDQVASSGGPYQFAVGGAQRTADAFAERHVAFSAHTGPRGTSGEFTSHRQLPDGSGPAPLVTFTGEVTCLRIDGNRAVIGGIIRHSFAPETEGRMFFAAVEDNGEPSRGSPPDRVGAYFIGVPPGDLTCDEATSLYATLAPVESGNVRVSG